MLLLEYRGIIGRKERSFIGHSGDPSHPYVLFLLTTKRPTLPTTRLLRQLTWRAPLNKFGLVGSPPGVVDPQRPFQRVEFSLTQVFFSLITVLAYLLLFHMTLLDSGWPDSCQLLKLEQILRQYRLQLFKGFHALLLPVSKLVTMLPHPQSPQYPTHPPRRVHPGHLARDPLRPPVCGGPSPTESVPLFRHRAEST